MKLTRSTTPRKAAGFTLIELVVVVGLIAITAAVSLPAIARFIRNYRLRGAAQQVAGELQRARATAVKQNVNLGVVLMITGPRTYRYVVEDPGPRPPGGFIFDDAFLTDPNNNDRVAGERTLPPGIEFADAAAECPNSTLPPISAPFAADSFAVRFNRLGAVCVPTAGNALCPAVNPARVNALMTTNPAGIVACVRENISAQSRTLLLLPSGQVVDRQ